MSPPFVALLLLSLPLSSLASKDEEYILSDKGKFEIGVGFLVVCALLMFCIFKYYKSEDNVSNAEDEESKVAFIIHDAAGMRIVHPV
jgi:hypothetical protein